MSTSEQDKVHQIMEDVRRGNQPAESLRWDAASKTIRPGGHTDPDGDALQITPSDMKHFADRRPSGQSG